MVLLHELTHTSAGGEREDVAVAKAGAFGLFKGKAYGWENMKRLAKKLPYVDTRNKNACDNNADSLAYFALGMIVLYVDGLVLLTIFVGCDLMSDSDNPFTITDDGKLEPLSKAVTWMLDNWERQ